MKRVRLADTADAVARVVVVLLNSGVVGVEHAQIVQSLDNGLVGQGICTSAARR